jgi:hypothetical protein
MKYTEALNKFICTTGTAAYLARAGKFEDAASLLLKMGFRGNYWRACREAAGLAYDDATSDALMAELIAAKKARFKK